MTHKDFLAVFGVIFCYKKCSIQNLEAIAFWYSGQGANHILIKENNRKRKVTESVTAYIKETREEKIGNRTITITNLTPDFSADEKRAVKLQIEQKLYDVFCKYASFKF